MPSTSTDDYELALLKRGPRNAWALMIGGAVMLLGGLVITVLTRGRLEFIGAALAGVGVMGKGRMDLARAKVALQEYEQDRDAGSL
jgi:hypothetical protein